MSPGVRGTDSTADQVCVGRARVAHEGNRLSLSAAVLFGRKETLGLAKVGPKRILLFSIGICKPKVSTRTTLYKVRNSLQSGVLIQRNQVPVDPSSCARRISPGVENPSGGI